MKKIYIILSYTGTVLSKLIKLSTNDEYSHVSISLDKKLENMYSFGRLNPYNPFYGGFVHESPNFGTFKRFKNTKCKIYELKITDEQYELLQDKLELMNKQNKIYKFNLLGLIGAKFRYKIKRKNSYYCAEFIKCILDESLIENNIPNIPKPEDFKKLKDKKDLYEGLLIDYKECK